MLVKFKMPNGGTAIVLGEQIEAMEIGPTPADGSAPVTTLFMSSGTTHPITYDQAVTAEQHMLMHPVAASAVPATATTTAAK